MLKGKSLVWAATATAGISMALWSCGSKDGGGGGGSSGDEPAPAVDPSAPAPAPAPAPGTVTTQSTDGKVQLGDEAIGIKNGEQLISHFSLMTGVKFEGLQQGDKDAINRLKLSMPQDNAAGKFNSAHVLATTKLATIFCRQFVGAERNARQNPANAMGYVNKLPDLDWGSQKLPKELARPLYATFIEIFWGVDTKNLPAKDEANAALDELVDALALPVNNAQGQPQTVNLEGSVTALCIAGAASFPSVEL